MERIDEGSRSNSPGNTVLQWLGRQPLARFLYNHNPFYVVSAALVFWGLRCSFDTARGSFNAWPLTVSLAIFTVMLVATAVLIIRWGKVWEDARSILLLVVLMFLGMSVTFDSVLASQANVAKWYYLGGLAFAIAMTETALRALPLRLPALYRGPFYLVLSLFYLYPLLMTDRLHTPSDPALQWQLFGFSGTAAIVFLTLLPAVRRGPEYANDNHSPWRWPLFPWTMFGMLWFCVCLRAFYLCQSLHFVDYAHSIFGWYFLAPMLLVAAVLFVEGGLVTGSRRTVQFGLSLPAIMVLLSAVGHREDVVYLGFLNLILQSVHVTPFYAGLLAAIVFYLVAAARRVEHAGTLALAGIAALAVVGPRTLTFPDLQIVAAWPLAVAGASILLIGLHQWQSARVAIGAFLLLSAAIITWRGTWFTLHPALLPLHSLAAILIAVGAIFDDTMARRLRRWAATLLGALAVLAIVGHSTELGDLPRWLVILYPLLMVALAVVLGRWLRTPRFLAAAAVASCLWMVVYGSEGYVQGRRQLAGFDQLLVGLVFFGCAILISLAKAGVLQRRIAQFLSFCRRHVASWG